ncbi:MAG: hypothetical protein V7K48_34725 [Nostoc sp.]|uniref:hypothetical protein n=1 Tax=Nostoc sp. TaxID=1180 RepID=UPI002FF93225
MLLGTHNRTVQKTFIGVPDADLEHPLGGMKIACLLTPDDTVDMILLRMMLFWFEFKGNLPAPIYAIPTEDYQSRISNPYRPEVKLIFREDYSDFLAENKLQRAVAEISWRLVNETSASINKTQANLIALRIKEVFAEGQGFTWEKGTLQVTYRDPLHGIRFSLFVASQAEAIRVIERVLEVAEVAFNEELISVSKTNKTYPVVPSTHEVYGKEVKGIRRRPLTDVRFYRAELHVYGLRSPIRLVDLHFSGESLV